jgi:hypothetical protein
VRGSPLLNSCSIFHRTGLPIAFTMRLQSGNGSGSVVLVLSEVSFIAKHHNHWQFEVNS